jgi:hypothetical protein
VAIVDTRGGHTKYGQPLKTGEIYQTMIYRLTKKTLAKKENVKYSKENFGEGN